MIGNVAKAGATTASAAKQIVDVIKAKRAQSVTKHRDGAAAADSAPTLPKPLEKALSQKSIDFLQQLARETVHPKAAETATNINARIVGSGSRRCRLHSR